MPFNYLLFIFFYCCLLSITSAAITPGTQPHRVRRNVIRIDPQPLSITARGGKMIDKITLQKLIITTCSPKQEGLQEPAVQPQLPSRSSIFY